MENQITIKNKNNEIFIIHYLAGDLYWTMVSYNESNEFIITKQDEIIYSLIDELFKKIKDNDNTYDKLLNDDIFEWKSESYGLEEEQNKLTIERENHAYRIKFYQNLNNKFLRKDICSICFCLSGSKNQKIANDFSMLYHEYMNNSNEKIILLKKAELLKDKEYTYSKVLKYKNYK